MVMPAAPQGSLGIEEEDKEREKEGEARFLTGKFSELLFHNYYSLTFWLSAHFRRKTPYIEMLEFPIDFAQH